MNGRQKIWVGGELIALFHKPQAVADGASSTSTICIDLRASDLDDAMAYIKKQCNSIAMEVADGKAPPRKALDDGVGGWLRPKEVGLFKEKDPEQVMREAQHQANFEAAMEPSRQLHKEGHLAKDAVAAVGLMEQLEQPAAESLRCQKVRYRPAAESDEPAAEKAKEAEKEPKRRKEGKRAREKRARR
jgi:hypothetical protein